jgi:uncharacterized membrane protein YkoI
MSRLDSVLVPIGARRLQMTTRTPALTAIAAAIAIAGLVDVHGALGAPGARPGGSGSPEGQAEKKVEMKDLPAVVQKAVQEQTKGLTVKGLAKEVEDGKTFYEAETTVNGHAKDFLFDTAGKLVEIEEEVALDSVPAAVKTALEAEGKIVLVETVTKGKKVTYEGTVEKNGKKSEIALDATGKKIKG